MPIGIRPPVSYWLCITIRGRKVQYTSQKGNAFWGQRPATGFAPHQEYPLSARVQNHNKRKGPECDLCIEAFNWIRVTKKIAAKNADTKQNAPTE